LKNLQIVSDLDNIPSVGRPAAQYITTGYFLFTELNFYEISSIGICIDLIFFVPFIKLVLSFTPHEF